LRTIVLGIGNLILCDEGVGVHAARALMREELGTEVEAIEVGTAFLDALPAIETAERIIVVDAMQGGEAPGTVYRIPFAECVRPECIASLHGFDLSRVMYLAGRSDMPEVTVFGVEPARIDWGVDLSPEIAAVLPELVEIVKQELAQ
jgi:hydrogenase maturation protease